MDDKILTITFMGMPFEVRLRRAAYGSNGRPAITAETQDGEPFATLTVNIEEACIPNEGYAFLDTNNVPGIKEFFIENELGTYTGVNGTSGWCRYPLMKLNMEKLERIADPLE